MPDQLHHQWLKMAEMSADPARLLMNIDVRSAASRFYYAAYQASTAMLLFAGMQPPIGEGERREAWSHDSSPEMVRKNLVPLISNRHQRNQWASDLGQLYKTRLAADYKASYKLTGTDVTSCRKSASWIVKAAAQIIGTSR
jgi:uncharacterized protein (UPF0332 family)